MNIDFNTNILTELLAQHPDKLPGLYKKFSDIEEWQRGSKKPTINKLSNLANFFNIPFGYFFLKQMPLKEYPITHYRTMSKGAFKPSEELLDTIEILQQRQTWASEMLKELGNEPLKFASVCTVDTDIKEAAELIRDILNVHENWALHHQFNTWNDALKFLVIRAENAGIYVVTNGIVGNDTHRKLNPYEFRGFVLYDEYAPFIFINNLDFISGKIFTLIHEIAHILLGVSASFDFENLQPANTAIEEFCDKVAAEFLVSSNSLNENFNKFGNDYSKLQSVYKVSKIVIARRLLDLDKISYQDFLEDLNVFKAYKIETTRNKDEKDQKGDFYNNQPNRISPSFFNLLYSAVKQNKLLYRDAFTLSGLTGKTFDGYVDKYILKKEK